MLDVGILQDSLHLLASLWLSNAVLSGSCETEAGSRRFRRDSFSQVSVKILWGFRWRIVLELANGESWKKNARKCWRILRSSFRGDGGGGRGFFRPRGIRREREEGLGSRSRGYLVLKVMADRPPGHLHRPVRNPSILQRAALAMDHSVQLVSIKDSRLLQLGSQYRKRGRNRQVLIRINSSYKHEWMRA